MVEKTISTYEKLVRDLQKKTHRLRADHPSSKDRMAFLRLSAAIYHLCPSKIADQDGFFRKVYYQEQLALIDRRTLPEIRQKLTFTGAHEQLRQAHTCGRILVSFHYGSFFASLAAFSAYELQVMVGMAGEVYQKIKDDLASDARKLANHDGSNFSLELLDLGAPMSIFRMVRKLRSGKDVFLFIDADSRQRIDKSEQRKIRIPFLDGALLVSSGAAYLSYLTGAAIVPILSPRIPNGQTQVEFKEWIYPDTAVDAETFAGQTMQRLFMYLEKQVLKDPTQWEGWLYIHNLVERRSQADWSYTEQQTSRDTDEYRVNQERYALIAEKKDHYLFDRQQYRMLWIPEALFGLLDDKSPQQSVIQADEPTMDFLFRNQILLPQKS
ncbi:hypothetical protein [Olivibacter sp. XZL3]|uniref:LpxL/LpxP family acyltransferase n=1 Tax=Olivibacter sp. XZL3 TaxID=1735116 RepID=UPI0014170F56|nr:hypothetical protein [Olivibacter sp. XZL3]